MIIKEAFNELVTLLIPIYGQGEARSLTRIAFEDAFKIFDFNSDMLFKKEHEPFYNEIKERLRNKEPIQYILGMADFYGYKFKVTPNVLIPRQETEELVFWIKEEVGKREVKILDIGTGSACIPISLKKLLPQANIHALDISEAALMVARENAKVLNTPINFFQQDILNESDWTALPKFDIIVSNPPYIPRKEQVILEDNVLQYEPHIALFVEDEDPLLFYRKIAHMGQTQLADGGSLFFELNTFTAKKVEQMLVEMNYKRVELRQDLSGNDRMIKAIR